MRARSRRRSGLPTAPIARREHPQQHLRDFAGILQADAYGGYSKIYDGGRVAEAVRWAHVRRKFVDLYELHQSPVAAQALERIGALYAIEQQIRGRPPDERRAVRSSTAVRSSMHQYTWLQQTLGTLSQKSATAKAIRYALSRWEALGRYCEDGRIEIDNNAAERALRCVALGRKKLLIRRQRRHKRDRAAAIYSLLGTAKLNGHDPEAFLRDVLARIGEHPILRIDELLPWNLQAPQQPPLAESDVKPQLSASA